MLKLRLAVLLLLLSVFSTLPLSAETTTLNTWNPEALSREFDYLSAFMNPDCSEIFDPNKILNILESNG